MSSDLGRVFDLERVLVVYNPYSSTASLERLESEVRHPLKQYINHYEELKTAPFASDGSKDLQGELREGDLVVACGGDGTVNYTANAIIESGLADKTVLMTLPFGRGNDIACGINGSDKKPDIHTTLKENSYRIRRDIGAIAIKVTGQNDSFDRHAIGYAGIGITAMVANKLNEPDVRQRAKQQADRPATVVDVKTILPLVLKAQPFEYYQQQEYRQSLELLFVNNKRMARYFRFNKSIYDNDCMGTVNIKNLPDLLFKLTAQQLKQSFEVKPISEHALHLDKPTALQYDAETRQLEADTDIKLWFIPSALGVMACRPLLR
jgi:diacylglycerol kinase family enzyme